jgi:hypothetical protein
MPSIPSSSLTQALRGLYGTASTLNDFMDSHIAALKASGDKTISATGELLAAAKSGFMLGYAVPIAVVAVGQLLLGNPLTAVVASASMMVSPVAISCAAVGAIWMGWRALKPVEQARILEAVKNGLDLSITVVTSVIEFVIKQSQAIFGKPQIAALRDMIRNEAAEFGKTLAQVTGSAVDAVMERLPRKPATPQGDNQSLTEVLGAMDRREVLEMLSKTFGHKEDLDKIDLPVLRSLAEQSLAEAASYSWPWSTPPNYPETVALVAKRLGLPSSSRAHVRDLERMVLFKVVDLSLEKLDEAQKADVVRRVEGELRSRGIDQRVGFGEIVSFVKTGGVDIGGTLGGLVLAAPGLYGVIGLNFLQFVVLKGIVMSSGYLAGGAALIGFGTPGLLLAMAGWAGPVGAGLAVVFTAHSISGPAFRKLVPAVCLVAAKRLELSSREPALNQRPADDVPER